MHEINPKWLRRLYWGWKDWGLAVKRFDRTQQLIVLFLALLSVFMLLPIVYVFNHAFKPLHELFQFPPTFIVRNATFQNFIELLSLTESTVVPASRYMLNSIIVTFLATVGMVVTGALCAYALSKHRFPGSKLIFGSIIASLLFAPETIAIPRYVIVQSLGIMNSYLGHVLPMIAMPVGVFLIKQFIDQVPNEMIEAAKIDGTTEFGIFMRIVVPMVTPAIATITILAFQNAWGNAETSTLFMQDDSMKTLPFYMGTLTSNLANSVARQGAAAAGALIMFLPSLIIFLLSQRKVIATMAHSGIK
ncbi:carbohydrate ABC transporter permease [Paenibacillus spongiae]|uniref:Carbohydrate ABC transporter permease n=1 Tax=Paenibacillus spongiae TaxID=2909671 RepID=A0ABY5SAM6_9BACL|nr:carbohydrate ABC transporter permease [Paenibacillus spongiae]UVI29353.1 carbohydrate ABC transporter permease [Paenibacillus spongiae]